MLKWDFNHEKRALMGFKKITQLVGGLEPWNFVFHIYIGNVIIPSDELILFRGVETTNQS